jgi:hypothetical protein
MENFRFEQDSSRFAEAGKVGQVLALEELALLE